MCTSASELLTAQDYSRAGELIGNGELVVFPTETVYGLGASAVNSDAVRQIYRAKERPQDNPLIIHFGSLEEMLLTIPRSQGLLRQAVKCFSPGPLTVIVPAPAWAVPEVRHNLPTIAIRVPSLRIAQKIISAAGVPVAAPSANQSGRPSPTTAAMAYQEMNGRVAAVVDGGDCAVGIESTIIRADGDRELIILRPGSISKTDLTKALNCPVHYPYAPAVGVIDSVVPGSRYRHYQPSVPVVLMPPGATEDALEELASLGKDIPYSILTVQNQESYQRYAEQLYRSFWHAEQSDIRVILAEMPPPGVAEGLADRLERAGTGVYKKGELRTYLFTK